MRNPIISVIVPVYNAEKYLRRCVDSILAQTFTDFELLLINDGSKDNSGAICDEYAATDARVRVFHKENGGVSSARNLGLDNAKCGWIAFCDADDYVENNWLDIYYTNLDNVDMVVQGYSNEITLKKYNFDYTGDVIGGIGKMHKKHTLGFLHVKIFNNRILKENGVRFNESVSFREDEDFVLKYLTFIKNVKCVKTGGYNYVISDLSKKYMHIDNFSVSLSMYDSVMKIYNGESNSVTKAYLLELINAYYYSFYNYNVNHAERTKLVKKIVGNKILAIEDVSKISRIILYYFPSYLVSSFFKVKALVSK